MQSSYSISSQNQTWQTLPERILYWVEQNAICLADLHLDRAAHLRKNGFPLPDIAHEQDLLKLEKVCKSLNANKVYVLGDLFHSHTLGQFNPFRHVIEQSAAEWILIKGNHDVFEDEVYLEMGFSRVETSLIVDQILLKHEPNSEDLEQQFCISGHVHPGYQLSGKGRQSIKLPCFYFGRKQLILPAFSNLTGLFKVKHQEKLDSIVVCHQDMVRKVENNAY